MARACLARLCDLGSIGEVGEVLIISNSEEIISATAFEEMKTAAQALHEQHRTEIEAPFHKQEKQYSYLPACLRTALSGFGVDVSEAELRALCDTTIFGTTALKIVDAARNLGFGGTAKHNLRMEELTALVDAGGYPIGFVNLLPVSSNDAAHAYVIVEVSVADIIVYDLAHGERPLPLETFRTALALMRNVAVIVPK